MKANQYIIFAILYICVNELVRGIMLNKKDFIRQTENAIKEYSDNNIEEQSLLNALANYDL